MKNHLSIFTSINSSIQKKKNNFATQFKNYETVKISNCSFYGI